MSNVRNIQSHLGEYSLYYDVKLCDLLPELSDEKVFWVVDERLLELGYLGSLRGNDRMFIVSATEIAKDLQSVLQLVDKLLDAGLRRDALLAAVGGGTVQDIVCFISSIFMRGIRWIFLPTTLLAQCDSCVGSKSSINYRGYKNIFGTFRPPTKIYQCSEFINTLSNDELMSGIGEILKVSLIDSRHLFENALVDVSKMQSDAECLQNYIGKALAIKIDYVEKDEFDQKERLIFNLGHSFGHAIEGATNFRVPHGIAVALGIGIALAFAERKALIERGSSSCAREIIKREFHDYCDGDIAEAKFFKALRNDKKNKTGEYGLILPMGTSWTPSFSFVEMNSNNNKNIAQCLDEFMNVE